jgi:hypothetical protein
LNELGIQVLEFDLESTLQSADTQSLAKFDSMTTLDEAPAQISEASKQGPVLVFCE